jgi:hypothetical protein
MQRWVWFAFDPAQRLAGGEYAADDAGLLHAVLRGRGLEPLLVLTRARWEEDLAGGPSACSATDDDGLNAAAEWKGQLEFVCEQWLLDASSAGHDEVSDNAPVEEPDEPDAHTAASLLDD